MIHDKMENLLFYLPQDKREAVKKFLDRLASNMEEGEYEIAGKEIFARIMSYQTQLPPQCKIEAHDIYCDIQFSIVGSEGISIYPREELKVYESDAESDVCFLGGENRAMVHVENLPGYFTMIHPYEAHRPMEAASKGCAAVKKGVIKIKEQVLAEWRKK